MQGWIAAVQSHEYKTARAELDIVINGHLERCIHTAFIIFVTDTLAVTNQALATIQIEVAQVGVPIKRRIIERFFRAQQIRPVTYDLQTARNVPLWNITDIAERTGKGINNEPTRIP